MELLRLPLSRTTPLEDVAGAVDVVVAVGVDRAAAVAVALDSQSLPRLPHPRLHLRLPQQYPPARRPPLTAAGTW